MAQAAAQTAQPKMLTEVPGPKSKELLAHLAQSGGGGGAQTLFVDVAKSHGNNLVDADGNTILDAFGMIASLPLGYNHPRVMEKAKTLEWQQASTHRLALGMVRIHAEMLLAGLTVSYCGAYRCLPSSTLLSAPTR